MADKLTPAQVVGGVLRMFSMPLVFLFTAGTWRWWEAWALCGIYLGYAAVMWAWLARHDPDLMRERMKAAPMQAGQKAWDKVLSVAMLVSGVGLIFVPGLDERFGWSDFPLPAKLAAMGLTAACFVWIGFVMRENTYLSRVVKVDEARGHQVITTGPYAVVRHPMYSAVIPAILAMPVALGSTWGVLAALPMVLALLVRTALEDRTLHAELAGYPEYARQTRFRLVPGLW